MIRNGPANIAGPFSLGRRRRSAYIRRLGALDAEALGPLFQESERLGFRFVRRLADDYAAGVNRFDAPGEALFGAFDVASGTMLGVGGLNIDPHSHPLAGSRGAGARLYVAASCRGQGSAAD